MEFTYAPVGGLMQKLMRSEKLTEIPQTSGVYVIDVPCGGFIPVISNETTGPEFHDGDSMLYPAEELREKFLRSDRKRIYIGQTGKTVTLRRRISQILRYGMGRKNAPHRGGRAVWQIAGSGELLLG